MHEVRPLWAERIGLHALLLNGEEKSNPYPRLRYKRKIGSHVIHPFAEQSVKEKEETKYWTCYKEMRNEKDFW